MANTCGHCSGDISPPAYDCNYCNLILCSDCRLPESHNCAGLSVTRTEKVFESGAPSTLGNSPDDSGSSESEKEPREIWDPPGFGESGKNDSEAEDGGEDNGREDDVNNSGIEVGDEDEKPESADISHDLPGTSREPDKDRSPSVTTKRELGNRDDGPDWSRMSEGDSKSTIQRISSWLGFIVLSPFLLIRWIWGQLMSLLTTLVRFPATLLTSPQFWIGILLVGGAAVVLGPGPSVIGDTLQDASESADDAISTGSGALADDDVNTTRVEHEVHARINEIRSERGLQPLRHDPELQDIARGHSQSMATNDYLAHEAPDGDTFEDRYQQAGYDCRVSTGSNQYTTGGENIAYTYASSDIDVDYGDTVNYNGNETKIARGIVRGWMNSSGHRENLLQPYWENEGIGVAVSETDGRTKVYATQNFC